MHRYGKSNLVYVSLLVILLLSQVAINFRSASHHNDELAEIWGVRASQFTETQLDFNSMRFLELPSILFTINKRITGRCYFI